MPPKPQPPTNDEPKRERAGAKPKPVETPPPSPPRPAASPPASRWTVGNALLALIVALTLVLAVIGVLKLRDGDDDGTLTLDLGVPTEASVSELMAYATPTRPVYWIGPPRSGRLEVTRTTGDSIYVRYLPEGVELGDSEPKYTTIGTYPMRRAHATMLRSARTGTLRSARIEGGALAVWRRSPGTSVYVAYRRVPYLVEVYDPNPLRARSLAIGGRVERVP